MLMALRNFPHLRGLLHTTLPKNNYYKQIVWSEIAESLELSEDEVQALWKRTRKKYKAALDKSNAPSGSARRPQKQIDTFLLQEMDFLRPYIHDAEPTTTSYSGANSHLFHEMAADPDVEVAAVEESSAPKRTRKGKPDGLTKDIEASLERLQDIASKILEKPQDPFYLFFETEMEKLPAAVKDELKSEFLNRVYEAKILNNV